MQQPRLHDRAGFHIQAETAAPLRLRLVNLVSANLSIGFKVFDQGQLWQAQIPAQPMKSR